jgi:4-aminobutyrate aminotransferase-like enzyme
VTLKFLIETINKDNLLERAVEVGTYALDKLKALSEKYPAIRNPRGVGLMIGFDLPFDAFTEERNPGKELIDFMEQNGVMTQAIRRGATFRIIPSYLITKEDIDLYIEKLEEGLKHINL